MFTIVHRLSYIVFALEKIMSMYQEKKVFVLYDIACLLQKHLQVSIHVLLLLQYVKSANNLQNKGRLNLLTFL